MKKDNWKKYQEDLIEGYDNEKVVSIVNSNIQVKKFNGSKACFFKCPECGKEIKGMNRGRVAANAKTHIISQHKEIYSEVIE